MTFVVIFWGKTRNFWSLETAGWAMELLSMQPWVTDGPRPLRGVTTGKILPFQTSKSTYSNTYWQTSRTGGCENDLKKNNSAFMFIIMMRVAVLQKASSQVFISPNNPDGGTEIYLIKSYRCHELILRFLHNDDTYASSFKIHWLESHNRQVETQGSHPMSRLS